ncbi:DUF6879 family protein [Streptomyces sp. NPDC058417]|uniref:DUF6879 family protein n=1 Tax=unclassified Streptomyces TaxID=2593676 RepID=UPI003667C45F
MFDSFPDGVSERLDRPAYHKDLGRSYVRGVGFLNKLERGQHFEEHGFASWEAFAAGDWEAALSLADEGRENYAAELRRAEDLGIPHRRLRVVEFPITPYVQWELHVLRVRVDLGDAIRILDARDIADIERMHPVPEVVVLGESVMYEVVYENGKAAGANRYTDRSLIRETNAGFDALYERGEAFRAFFEREIAPLPAPQMSTASAGASASRFLT